MPAGKTDSDADGGKAVTALLFTGWRPRGCPAHFDLMDERATDAADAAGADDPGR